MAGKRSEVYIRKTISRYVLGLLSFLVLLSFYSTSLWAGNCPQPRNTLRAPADIYKLVNPIDPSFDNILVGKALFEEKAKPLACRNCHGTKGDGRGPMSIGLSPSAEKLHLCQNH